MKPKVSPFTMIEMLVVISIIVVLAGMTFGIMRMVWQKNAEASTRATIGVIRAGLDKYQTKNGYFPIYPAPVPPATSVPTNNIPLHYLRVSTVQSWGISRDSVRHDGTFVIDYWKNPLRYRSPGIMSPMLYDVWSAGADRKDGRNTGDLATSMTRGKCDDIGNWGSRR